jgi:hypothetical protein
LAQQRAQPEQTQVRLSGPKQKATFSFKISFSVFGLLRESEVYQNKYEKSVSECKDLYREGKEGTFATLTTLTEMKFAIKKLRVVLIRRESHR